MRLSVSSAFGRLSQIANWTGTRVVCGLAVLMGLLAMPVAARAQAVSGTLLGNVTDASGGAVPGATVTAVETQTNISRTAVTNEAGNYIFSSLRNGTYSVEAELTGFRKVMRQNVRVDVNTTMRVDLTLELGQMNEAVTVAAETPAPPDGPHGHGAAARIEGRHRASPQLQSQLPGLARDSPRCDATVPAALAVLQLAGQPEHRDQRPAAHGQQHAD